MAFQHINAAYWQEMQDWFFAYEDEADNGLKHNALTLAINGTDISVLEMRDFIHAIVSEDTWGLVLDSLREHIHNDDTIASYVTAYETARNTEAHLAAEAALAAVAAPPMMHGGNKLSRRHRVRSKRSKRSKRSTIHRSKRRSNHRK